MAVQTQASARARSLDANPRAKRSATRNGANAMDPNVDTSRRVVRITAGRVRVTSTRAPSQAMTNGARGSTKILASAPRSGGAAWASGPPLTEAGAAASGEPATAGVASNSDLPPSWTSGGVCSAVIGTEQPTRQVRSFGQR